MEEILIHKRLIDKIDYIYRAYPKGFMYVDKGNIQRDIGSSHYRFKTHEPIVRLLGANLDFDNKDDFINIKDTNIKIKE